MSFFDNWQLKGIIAFVVGLSGINIHINLLFVFILLVILDLISKQLSLSAKFISNTFNVKIEDIETWDKIKAIPLAINAGYIKSFWMRKKFLTKMATYIFAVITAKLTDTMILGIQEPLLLHSTYAYLGATELLSIFENLRDGGNKTIGKLLDIINKKLMSKLK